MTEEVKSGQIRQDAEQPRQQDEKAGKKSAERSAERSAEKRARQSGAEKQDLSEQSAKEKKELEEQLRQARDALLRTAAEFENFKKRTAKEKEAIYSEAVCATVGKLLPCLDNLERAAESSGDAQSIRKGVELTLKQFLTAFDAIGVEEIEARVGSPLDPNLHNAMMRVEDPELEEGTIAQVLAKGYKIGDRVIRYTMVKSAN